MNGIVDMYYDSLMYYPIITSSVIALFVILVAVGLFFAIDSWFLPESQGEGRVIDKIFIPAHKSVILVYNAATKVSTPTFHSHPDYWEIKVEMNGNNDTVEVSKKQFNKLNKGDTVKVNYSIGRFSSKVYIKECLN
jgi:hypothetical protein